MGRPDQRFMEADAQGATRALEARYGADTVAQQARIQASNFAKAEALNASNTRSQFEASLRQLGRAQADAHTGASGQNWLHYTHVYERTLTLAQACAALGDTVEIPRKLDPKGAVPMIKIGPRAGT